MTRIIAGRARGRRLSVPPAGTRPTSDRVREAMFSALDSERARLGEPWSELRVLDLYAGSGALGLEALSRGAASVLLVERSRAAASVLRANVRAVGLPGADVLVADVRRLATSSATGAAATLVLVDPPYDLTAAELSSTLAQVLAHGWIAPGADVVVERSARDAECPLPDTWTLVRRRDYGETALWYGQAAPAGPTDEEDA